ncbi:FCHO2 protein, partial [Sula dactylatra]|nr:FCHO2 protein [Sula dactylatra]
GEKNHGFDVLYHNMKHGQISTKELADFVRERAAIEENYAKAMVKLSKMATNGTQLGTFAPLWEVFRISSDKLALCHLELMKKLHDLIKEISRYGEEQGRVHKKDPFRGMLTLGDVLPFLSPPPCPHTVPWGRATLAKPLSLPRQRFQEVEEAHLRHMKGLIGSYSHSVEDTHVQIGQVHEEFKQNVENIGTEMLLRRFAESKGTGQERPGPKRSRSKAFRIPGLSRKERDRDAVASPSISPQGCPEVDEDGFTVRPDVARSILVLEWEMADAENHVCSSSDSDYDEDEPRKFYVHIKPVQPREAAGSAEATMEQLKATVGNLILPPSIGVSLEGGLQGPQGQCQGRLTPCPYSLAGHRQATVVPPRSPSGDQPPLPCPSSNSASSSSSSPAPPSGGESSSPSPWTCQGSGTRLTEGTTPVAPPPHPEPGAAPLTLNSAPPQLGAGSHPAPAQWRTGLRPAKLVALVRPCRSPPGGPAMAGLSRGPSPVVLGSQDALPVATAFTEYVHAYFKGRDADSCLVKVTGELTMSFPAGIIRVFSGSMAPPVLSFRLLNASAIEQFLPNAELLYSDPSQSDPSTKDFWLNMAALTGHLQKQAEQNPAASYYNVALLKYQFSRLGPGSAPLRLCVHWECSPDATRVSVEYSYNASALALPVPLTNVHVLLPVDEPVTNLRLQPTASWNLEEKRLLWRLLDVPGAPGQGGCGRLSASWEPLCGPSKPSPVAAQFSSEGSTLSGVEVELAGAGYRMSLVKKRFATG